MCRAANALHSGRFQWLQTALNDADLQRVIATWDAMPEAIRIAVMALVGTVVPSPETTSVQGKLSRPGMNETAWRLARECRQIVQGCLREDKWQDADREFFDVIRKELVAEDDLNRSRGH
jgi:hypothetical protein